MIKAVARLVIVTALVFSAAGAWSADPNKVLRLAFPDISGLDPQQVSDLYSVRIAQQIFEGLYEYSYLADPVRVIPTRRSRAGDRRRRPTWTIRVQKGIRFTDDPVFKGRPRELVAQDYVYSIKRWLDPNLKAGGDRG